MATGTLTPQATAPKPAPAKAPPVAAHPFIGILGVFVGAGTATLNSRLIGVGLADLRGALGLGFDEAAWIPTALNMALMFSGVFCVFLNGLWGPRRILLPCAAVFMLASIALPFSHTPAVLFTLLVIAGLASGTFYSLTLTFALVALPRGLVIWGIAAYAADIVFSTNIAAALEGWYLEHASWHWIFWNAAVFMPLMMLCIYFGVPGRSIPAAPRPSWRGFTYFSFGFALLYGALDQGERLYWLHSGVIVGLLASGSVLVIATFIRRMRQPNPIANLAFLRTRNIMILAASIFVFRFVMLTPVVLIPGFLGNIQRYRPLETGHALAWVALPMFVIVWAVAWLIIQTNSRAVFAAGLTIIAGACWAAAKVDPSWAGNSFEAIDLALSGGLACAYVGMVGSIVLEALEAGALSSAADVCTFSGVMHFVRIFGGGVGVAAMTRFLTVREEFHSNLLGLHVQFGHWLTDTRLFMLGAGVFARSSGADGAHERALEILGQQIRGQAYTMAIQDGFVLMCWVVIAFLLVMLYLRRGKVSYNDLRKM